MSHNLVDTEIAESLIKVKSHKCKMISSGLQLWLRSALKNIKPTAGFKLSKFLIVPESGKSLVMDVALFRHLIEVWLSVGSFYLHPRHRNSSGHQTNMSKYVLTSANVYGCTELDKESYLSEMKNPVESVSCFRLAVVHVLNARGYLYLISWAPCVKWDNCLAG